VVQELTRQGYETYLPLVAIRRRDPVIASMWHEVRVPLFPGYAFIRMTNAETREPIAATKGVRELLHRPDGRLSVVSDGEVDRLRGDDETRLRLPKETAPVLAAGVVVRITEGAFSGLSGVVAECDGVRTRVVLALFDRDVPIWLDRVAVVEVA
jgi:transcription antitermination factor NusG